MLLVEAPVFFPSTCICGEAHGRMVDTRIEKDVSGVDDPYRIYLCERCVVAAARLIGMVTAVEHDALAVAVDDAKDLVLDLELQIAELLPVRDALIGAAARFGELEPVDEPVRKAPRAKAA